MQFHKKFLLRNSKLLFFHKMLIFTVLMIYLNRNFVFAFNEISEKEELILSGIQRAILF